MLVLKNPRNRNGRKRSKFRKQVLKRDEYTCQMCGRKENTGFGRLEVHHIKSWHKYPELRWEVSNGITLCHKCHRLAERWEYHFKKVNNKWKIIGGNICQKINVKDVPNVKIAEQKSLMFL